MARLSGKHFPHGESTFRKHLSAIRAEAGYSDCPKQIFGYTPSKALSRELNQPWFESTAGWK